MMNQLLELGATPAEIIVLNKFGSDPAHDILKAMAKVGMNKNEGIEYLSFLVKAGKYNLKLSKNAWKN